MWGAHAARDSGYMNFAWCDAAAHAGHAPCPDSSVMSLCSNLLSLQQHAARCCNCCCTCDRVHGAAPSSNLQLCVIPPYTFVLMRGGEADGRRVWGLRLGEGLALMCCQRLPVCSAAVPCQLAAAGIEAPTGWCCPASHQGSPAFIVGPAT